MKTMYTEQMKNVAIVLLTIVALSAAGCDILRDLGGGPDRQSPGGSQTEQEQPL